MNLDACEDGNINQYFEFSQINGTVTVGNSSDSNLCWAKTSDVGPAGSFERTDFALANCEDLDSMDIGGTVSLDNDITVAPTFSPSFSPSTIQRNTTSNPSSTISVSTSMSPTETPTVSWPPFFKH